MRLQNAIVCGASRSEIRLVAKRELQPSANGGRVVPRFEPSHVREIPADFVEEMTEDLADYWSGSWSRYWSQGWATDWAPFWTRTWRRLCDGEKALDETSQLARKWAITMAVGATETQVRSWDRNWAHAWARSWANEWGLDDGTYLALDDLCGEIDQPPPPFLDEVSRVI